MKNTGLAGVLLMGALLIPFGAAHAQASAAPAASAQDPNAQANEDQDIALLRKDIRSKKKQLIAANLNLTADEATKFWPVYDQYTAELVKANNAKYAVIKEYANSFGSVTDAQAIDLIKRSLNNDLQVAQLRLKYVPLFSAVLPGRKVATYYQIEKRVQSLIDLQLTGSIPLVQDQSTK